ncbi:MAG: agmatine deiminase family protein [Prevotella sp.]|nr:agmatine deiminase family protein [Prevotella sp.]
MKTIFSSLHLPAEWYPQDAIQLTWPHADTDWKPYLKEITETFIQLAKAITRYEALVIVTPEPDAVRQTLKKSLSPEALAQITFCECATNDTWARDHGGITLTDAKGRGMVLDFRFNGWGDKFPAELDNQITGKMARQCLFQFPIEVHDDFVLEGGSIESNGEGTILTTSTCLLAPNRNQPLTRQEIETQLLRRLRAQRVIWLDHGNLIGDDTDGHIDTIVRFAPYDTLLYVGCDGVEDPQYEDFLALEQQLRTLRTPDGHPYRLLRLPMPHPIFDDGERLPATYANFVILNGAVLVPTYAQPDLDALACETISLAFPGLDIIGIDARVVVRQHGSLHCLTMQYPQGTFSKVRGMIN